MRSRARGLEKQRLSPFDALYLACTKTVEVDYFITCDDKLAKRYLETKDMKNPINEIPTDYREDVEKAVKILKNFGCKEIYLFGSLAEGNVREDSDIDLAVRGCPSGMFFHALGRLMLELEHPTDLIDLDRDDNFSRYLEKEGALIYVS